MQLLCNKHSIQYILCMILFCFAVYGCIIGPAELYTFCVVFLPLWEGKKEGGGGGKKIAVVY